MSPARLNPSSVVEGRIEQLQRKLRAKEERIAVLEMENGLLHLKLAQCQGLIGRNKNDMARFHHVCKEQKRWHKNMNSSLLLHNETLQRVKQAVKDLRSTTLAHFDEFQHQCKNYLTCLLAPVEKMQLQNLTMYNLQNTFVDLQRCFLELNERFKTEKQKRKKLHNSLIELRGNIRVHCRIRPFLPFDGATGEHGQLDKHNALSESVTYAADDETVLVKSSRLGHPLVNKTFQFERVYKPSEGQESVFRDVAPLLVSLLDGFNVCIMAYGQTGSGKTYTMLGPHSADETTPASGAGLELGLIPRATEELFRLILENPPGSHCLEVSVVEVYNNEIFDLLAKDATGMVVGVKRDVITTREGKSDVPLLTYEKAENAADVLHLVKKGVELRAKHPTLVHADSSRSHLVVTLTITTNVISWASKGALLEGEHGNIEESTKPSDYRVQVLCERGEKTKQVKTKLQLVDLAGSECVGMSGVTGPALREASFINRSLSALSDVLGALSEQRPHVPYRNSKLTHLLQDSIGGDAKLLVMLCVSPCQKYLSESLQSLGFGSRARQIQRGEVKKRSVSGLSKPK